MRFTVVFPQNVFAFILYYYWPTVIKKGLTEALRELQILGQGVAPSHEQSRKRLFFFTLLAPLGDPWTARSPKLIIFPGDIPHPHPYFIEICSKRFELSYSETNRQVKST